LHNVVLKRHFKLLSFFLKLYFRVVVLICFRVFALLWHRESVLGVTDCSSLSSGPMTSLAGRRYESSQSLHESGELHRKRPRKPHRSSLAASSATAVSDQANLPLPCLLWLLTRQKTCLSLTGRAQHRLRDRNTV